MPNPGLAILPPLLTATLSATFTALFHDSIEGYIVITAWICNTLLLLRLWRGKVGVVVALPKSSHHSNTQQSTQSKQSISGTEPRQERNLQDQPQKEDTKVQIHTILDAPESMETLNSLGKVNLAEPPSEPCSETKIYIESEDDLPLNMQQELDYIENKTAPFVTLPNQAPTGYLSQGLGLIRRVHTDLRVHFEALT